MLTTQNLTKDHLDLMQAIQQNNNISQRQISQQTGLSIGKINYCLKALIDIGCIKIVNFNNSSQKLNYTYILTPKGIRQKTEIIKKFITFHKQEYDKLNSYIIK